ncbi:MAG: tripartite tricarboxylate transporter TctB family protein [Trueperaceae bacterium]
MRLAFTLFLLALAAFYTWTAFIDLAPLTANGRLGPGFFPRVIGVALVVTLLYSIVIDRRFGLTSGEESAYARDIVIFTGLLVLFVAALHVLGGLLAMVAFMYAALTIFNRRRHLQNILVSVLLPTGIFLLFNTWLNAGIPEGILAFL